MPKCCQKCCQKCTKTFSKLVFFRIQSLSPEPGERSFTYLQVVPAFGGAKQVMTSDIIICTYKPFPSLQIKRSKVPAFVSKSNTQYHQVYFHILSSKVISNTFGNPYVQKVLQNQPSSPIIGVLRCLSQLCSLVKNCTLFQKIKWFKN